MNSECVSEKETRALLCICLFTVIIRFWRVWEKNQTKAYTSKLNTEYAHNEQREEKKSAHIRAASNHDLIYYNRAFDWFTLWHWGWCPSCSHAKRIAIFRAAEHYNWYPYMKELTYVSRSSAFRQSSFHIYLVQTKRYRRRKLWSWIKWKREKKEIQTRTYGNIYIKMNSVRAFDYVHLHASCSRSCSCM